LQIVPQNLGIQSIVESSSKTLVKTVKTFRPQRRSIKAEVDFMKPLWQKFTDKTQFGHTTVCNYDLTWF
jgi:hypothetical protein